MTTRRAIVVGVGRPFGAEIVAALAAQGFAVSSFELPADVVSNLATSEIEVLVFNAPVIDATTRFNDITDPDFEAALADHLFDFVMVAQKILPSLRSGGRIVAVGSRGHQGAWGGAHLMAASAAMAGMVRSMALELAAEGIAVNHVAAGFAGSSWDTSEARRHVAKAVCMLAEPDTGLVGETLIVDGGRSLRMTESRRR